MRPLLKAGFAASLFTVLFAGAASADMTVYYHVGSWDAFSGPGDNGTQVCGIGSTNPVDNRSLSLRFQIGGDTVTLQAKKPTWSIPAGTQLPVVMQIGLETPWNLQGVGNGQVVEWALDRAAMESFDAQFRRANSMSLSFPTGNEPPWTIGLNGSTAVSNAFGRCVTDLTQRAGAQAAPTTPPADQGPTQPFGQTPAQPAPTQLTPQGQTQPFVQTPGQPAPTQLAPQGQTQPVPPRQ
ncbi:MAG TPA: hypothetical protein VHT74_05565 [Acetobacteraceae bacterium]|jgi:hypothetical protein|nr:hypothetical protein [Acetobacteraceae bacterium]